MKLRSLNQSEFTPHELNLIIAHFQYSIDDITSYEDLTPAEQKIIDEESFMKLIEL